MNKRRRKKSSQQTSVNTPGNLQTQKACKQAEDLINSGNPKAAVELLVSILPKYQHNPDLHYYLGYAYIKLGNLWKGAFHYQQVQALRNNPEIWIPLTAIYQDLELRALSLHAFREILRHAPNHPFLKDTNAQIELYEENIREISEIWGLPIKILEEGLRLMEQAQIDLNNNNYSRCITLNRTAIKTLGNFPPPHNNLSLALFFSGQPEQAIQTAKGVLEKFPDNIQALANIIRFLAWTGYSEEARTYWEQLKQLEPINDDLRNKMREAAAIMEDDEQVYRLINTLEIKEQASIEFSQRTELDLAIAEANLGLKSAQRRLKKLEADIPWAGNILKALKNGQTGLGWSDRFPYFPASELIPSQEFDKFINQILQNDQISPRKFRREVDRFVARYPQIVLMAKKLIYEDHQIDAGVGMLSIVGTLEAYTVLREYGLSQVGNDETRMQALQELLDAEQIDPMETLRIWQKGKWREVQFRSYKITDESDSKYSSLVAELINRGTLDLQRNKLEQAEKIFCQVLEMEPRAKEACNNLGIIYSRRGDHQQAQKMYKKAMEIDHHYVLACCNLATYLLDDDKVAEVEELIKPLADLPRFTPQGIAMLSYIRARVAIQNDQFDEARNNLNIALEIIPDHGPSSELLDRLELMENMRSGWEDWQSQWRKRELSSRAKKQKQISTFKPTLQESLGIYTKEIMTGMGRVIIPWGGWSALKKTELHELLVENLQNEDVLKNLISKLSGKEIIALKKVLDYGGYLPWETFDSEYGNDLEESPYWQFHQPETIMGRLRIHGLIVEATIDNHLFIIIPLELRKPLQDLFK